MRSLPLWANVALLAAAAGGTWAAGARLTDHVDALAASTGARRSLLGALLLGGITSLPEVATVTTAAALGGSSFAVGNILGSTSANVAILAGGDAVVRSKPILGHVNERDFARQGAFVVVLLAVTACAVVAGEPFDLRIGLWTVGIVGLTLLSFALLHSADRDDDPDQARQHRGIGEQAVEASAGGKANEGERTVHTRRLVGAAVVILVAGFTAGRTGTVIADQAGLSGGFVGFSLLAVTTSLPEVSTTVSSLRMGRPNLAVGNILGTNLFNNLLFLPADLLTGRPLFANAEVSAVVPAMLGVVLLGIYLVRLTGPARDVGGRADIASVLVLVVYAAGTALLYGVG